MSPRDLSSAVVTKRLATMRQLLDDLDSLGEVTLELLERDRIARHAVERILTHLVTLGTDVNAHIAASVTAAPRWSPERLWTPLSPPALTAELGWALRPSIGLRNVLIHEYLELDPRHVVTAVVADPDHRGRMTARVPSISGTASSMLNNAATFATWRRSRIVTCATAAARSCAGWRQGRASR